MLQRFRAMRASDSGFTLVELLIVIVILGILTGIVVFAVGGFTDRGEMAACKSDKKTVEVAVEAYRAKNSSYPANLAILVPDYLRELPNSPEYAVSYVVATGAVSAALTDGTVCA